MTETEEKITKIQDSLIKLRGMGMNIPYIIISNPSPEKENERVMNVATVKAMAERIKQSVVIPSTGTYDYLETLKFWDAIKDYEGEAFLIFRAPKSFPLLSGICEPTAYYNKIQINNSDIYNIIWGDSVLKDFPAVLKKPINDLNGMLQRGRALLDGMSIRFSFHPQGEGTELDRVILWGMNYKE